MSTIFSLSEIGEKDISSIGVNAALLGELYQLGLPVTRGIVIPYRLVTEFMEGYGYLGSTVELAAQGLGSDSFMVTPSVVTEVREAYSSLSVFGTYNIQLAEVVDAIQKRALHFWHIKSLLDNGTYHAYADELINLAIVIQEYEEARSVITYSYDQQAGAVYFEYADSISQLRSGQTDIQKVVMGNNDRELTSLLIPSEYRRSFEEMRLLHNKISQIFNVPLEVCWSIRDIPVISQIRVVKEEVKAFSV